MRFIKLAVISMASSDLDPIATLPAFSGKNFLQLQLGIFVASSDLSILALTLSL